MNRVNYLAITVTFLSVIVAGYFYWQNVQFQEALLEQTITTANIQMLIKNPRIDSSFANIEAIAKDTFGNNVSVVEASGWDVQFGADRKALMVHDTLIFFKDGNYYGSRISLPNH